MKKLILFISLIISIAVDAQTYNGNITLTTQQDVDNFSINYPGINSVNGSLNIGPFSGQSDITSLSAINNLVSVNTMFIQNTQLTQISGFNSLTYCYNITIQNNINLHDINGFNSLTNINQISISSNNVLTTLNCFQNVTTISSLYIADAQINSLNFPNAQTINDLNIYNTNNITNFNGLQSLTNVSGLSIGNNSNNIIFSNYNFFNNLTSLYIENCNNISNITGLNFASNVTYINIRNCALLNDITPMNNIINAQSIDLNGLNSLQNLNGLSNLKTVGNLSIAYLVGLTDISGLNSLITTNNFNIIATSLYSLSPLNILNTITGNLNIRYNNNLTSLIGLNHPLSISGNLYIVSNPNLSNCAAQAICNYLGVNAANATIAGNATGCNSISEVTSACNPVPLTKIRTQDCGLQTTTFNQLFYCNSITGATYEFRYRDILTNVVSTKLRPNTTASLGDAGLLDINRTYSVRVRAKLNGVWGNYGDSCLIYSPTQVPLTKIRTQDCGLQTTTFNQLFYADVVTYSTGNYDFEFTDIATNIVTIKSRPNNIASLGDAGLFELNKTYSVRVRTKVGNNWGNYGTACLIYSPTQVPLTKIRTQDCGLQTTTFNQLFYADVVTYSTGNYDFEFTDIATNIVTIKSRPNNIASLGDAGLFELNKTYSVRVRTKVGNNWGNYGTACLIYSPTQVPLTKIRTQDCGLQTTTFTQLYYADAVSYATNYEFEYTDINTGAITYRLKINNTASLNDAGLTQYNKIYDVRVRAKVGNNWGAFGTVCQIKSPINVPVTQINSTYCNLFYTLDGEFSCDPVTNANAYEFEFTNTVTNSITSNIVTTEVNSFFAASLPFYDKIYSVRVRARIGTTWGSYGTSCILKSIGMEFQRLKSGDESSSADSKIESLIEIYPNPTTDIINITELTEPSIINVFNVSGQLVLTKSSAESNEKIDLSSLDNGIYIIVIEGKNGEIAKRQRVVLAK